MTKDNLKYDAVLIESSFEELQQIPVEIYEESKKIGLKNQDYDQREDRDIIVENTLKECTEQYAQIKTCGRANQAA